MDADLGQAGDRRRHPRVPRLIRLRVNLHGNWADGVTVDVSPSGAFVALPPGEGVRGRALPPPGTEVILRPAGHLGIIVSGVVRRVVLPGGGPPVAGYAVAFDAVRSTNGESDLRRFLTELGVRVDDDASPEGNGQMIHSSSGEATFIPRGVRLRVVESGPVGPRRIADASRMLLEELSRAERAVWDGEERRRTERSALRTEVTFSGAAEAPGDSARLTSVSRTGGFVQTSGPLPPLRSRLVVELPIPGAAGIQVRLTGRVVRHWDRDVEGAPGFAFVITQVDEGPHLGIFRVQLRRFAARFKATHYR